MALLPGPHVHQTIHLVPISSNLPGQTISLLVHQPHGPGMRLDVLGILLCSLCMLAHSALLESFHTRCLSEPPGSMVSMILRENDMVTRTG